MFNFIKKYFPKENNTVDNKELPKAKSKLGSVEPKKATNINKTVVYTVGGIFIIVFIYSLSSAMFPNSPEKEKPPQVISNTNNGENNNNPFQTLPGSYDEKTKKNKANPSDNKQEISSNKQKSNTNINNFSNPRPPALPKNYYSSNSLEEQRRKLEEKEFDDARKSKIGIFTFIANAAAQAKTITNAATNNSESDNDQNQQNSKESFIKNSSIPNSFNPYVIQKQLSNFEVKAGNIIPAALISGINTDLPGEIIAQVTENIFDSSTGEYLLIPQGSKIIGKYDSKVVFNQFRVLLIWQRIIFPNGKSIYINNLQGMDTEGYSGLRDQVDRHTPDLIKGIVLSTIFGAGAAIVSGNDSDDDSYKAEAGRGAGEAILDVGNEITRKNLNRQPTLKIRPGHTFTIMVNQDLILEAYNE